MAKPERADELQSTGASVGEFLHGLVVAVTGGASGIGQASTFRVAQEGARVAVIDRDEALGRETVEEIRHGGGEAAFHRADVTSGADLAACFDAIEAEWGRIDGLHNNAGVNGPTAMTEDYDEQDFDRVIATNLKAVWLGTKAVIPHLRRAGGGAIVNTGSTASLTGYAALGGYVAAKHGVLGLTKTAAVEYAPERIRVTCICPGPVDTPLQRGIEETLMPDDPAAAHELFAATTALKRYARPEEIAELAVFLLGDEASYLTGAAYSIDAGVLAGP